MAGVDADRTHAALAADETLTPFQCLPRRVGDAATQHRPVAGQQDLRVDMPTIGPRTVETVARAGLGGIAIEAGRVMIVDRAATIETADRLKIFLAARDFGSSGGRRP